MQDITNKIDNVSGSQGELTADEFNSLVNEVENLIKEFEPLDGAKSNQLKGAVAHLINEALTELKGGASAEYDTLKEVQTLIEDIKTTIGTGGTSDIFSAIATKLGKTETAVDSDKLGGVEAEHLLGVSYGATNQDPNTTDKPYICTKHANCPTSNRLYHIMTMFFETSTGYRALTQYAQYNSGGGLSKIFYRNIVTSTNDVGEWIEVQRAGKNLVRKQPHEGYLIGSHGSTGSMNTSNPIFTVSENYLPTADGLGNMYGVGYTYASGTALPNIRSGWGMYVTHNGNPSIFLNAERKEIEIDGKLVLVQGNVLTPVRTLVWDGSSNVINYNHTGNYTHLNEVIIVDSSNNMQYCVLVVFNGATTRYPLGYEGSGADYLEITETAINNVKLQTSHSNLKINTITKRTFKG